MSTNTDDGQKTAEKEPVMEGVKVAKAAVTKELETNAAVTTKTKEAKAAVTKELETRAAVTEEAKGDEETQEGEDDAAGPGERKSKRGRKAVEVIYKVEPRKEKVKFTVEQGKGKAFGDIPFIEEYIRKNKPENLKTMHSLLFGRKVAAKSVRANLRQFSGFVYAESEPKKEFLSKKGRWMEGQTMAMLKSCTSAFGMQTSGTKVEIIERLKDFLDKPQALKAPRASPKKSPRKASTPKKAVKKLSAWDWYCKERRPAQAAYEKDKTTSEITDILKTMWESELAESKAKYEAMAKAYAKKSATKSPVKKKTPKKTSKKTPVKKQKKAPKSTEFVEEDDDEDDDEDDEEEDQTPTKRKRDDADKGSSKKKAKTTNEKDESEIDEEEDDDEEATGLNATQLTEIKDTIKAYLQDHENYQEVRSKHVRKHLEEKIPGLEFTPEIKTFIENHAITVCDELGDADAADE